MDPIGRLKRFALVATVLANLTAAGAYTGAVTLSAFVRFLLPAVALASAASFLGTPRQYGGAIAALASAVGWAVVVNALSGETAGPVARSSAICGIATAMSVYSARRMWAPPMLLGVLMNLGGAMYYGAAGEVRFLALLIGLLALVAVSLLDAARHRRRVRRPRWAALLIGLLAAAAVSLGAVAVQQTVSQLSRDREPLASALITTESIRPPWSNTATPPTTTIAKDTAAQQQAKSDPEQKRLVRLILLLVALLILLLILAIVLRGLIGAWRLRRWKRRLQRQAPAASAGAAFGWMTYQLQRFGWHAPGNPAVDRLPEAGRAVGWPEPLLDPVRQVCSRSQRAVFENRPCANDTALDAWRHAEAAVAAARRNASRLRRAGAIVGLVRT